MINFFLSDGRVLQTTPSCDEDNQRPATHPITLPPPCHPSAPPLNMELNFVDEHQSQGNNTVQMPAASKILQGTVRVVVVTGDNV